MTIVLASGSPRRHQLLDMLGIPHDVDPSNLPETALPGESAEATAIRLARAKATQVAGRHPGRWVLGADHGHPPLRPTAVGDSVPSTRSYGTRPGRLDR